MNRKVLALLLIFLTGASFLSLGCADRKNADGPTITPAAAATASPTVQASAVPAGVPSVTAPTVTPGSPGTPSGALNLDPSLADISGEDNDLTGFPETGLPAPTLD
jgi:hypothetical protein